MQLSDKYRDEIKNTKYIQNLSIKLYNEITRVNRHALVIYIFYKIFARGL